MRSFVVAVVMFAAACGDVEKVTDAGVADAPGPDSAAMLTCAAGESVCNGTCANFQTSELYCGNCETQCAATFGCVGGQCVERNTSCARVREVDPDAADGVITNPNTARSFYCSFTTNTQYEFLTNPYTAAPTGYTVVRAADFGNAAFATAFIDIYNHDAGIRTASTFATTNCCMGPVAGVRYSIGGQIPFTGIGTSQFCNQNTAVNTFLTFGRSGTYVSSVASNFFTANPVTEVGGCSDGSNVAWWVKATTF